MSLRLLFALILLLFSTVDLRADTSVFIYHRFGESRYPSTNIEVEVFARQLDYLSEHHYKVLPLSEIARRVRAGETLPAKTVGLSVDDAFSSFLAQAFPLLKQHGFPVTLFVNTDSVGASGYLDWDELRQLVSAGVEIGNHTASHPYLVEMRAGETPQQWRQRLHEDLARGKNALKKQLGVEPRIFAYTYGEYSGPVIDLVREAGFKSAFAQQSGVIWSGADNWALPRFPMGGPYATLEGFVDKLKMKALRLEAGPTVDPVIRATDPPVLRLKLKDQSLAAGHFNCFAQAGNQCTVERVEDAPGEIRIVAAAPLHGRRNKYTLTIRDRGNWYWCSQLWINAERPVPAAISSGAD